MQASTTCKLETYCSHMPISTEKNAAPLQYPTGLCAACRQISLTKLSKKGQKIRPKSSESTSCPFCQLLCECCCQPPGVPYTWRLRRPLGYFLGNRTKLSLRLKSEYICVSMRK